jgi:hypothetical protein
VPDIEDQRAARHRRIPLVRGQIFALREAAVFSSEKVGAGPPGMDAGHMLTANMQAAFALELSLKLFHMTYAEAEARGHDLKRLFNELPPKMCEDIRAAYEAPGQALPNIKAFAFQTSPIQPAPPTSGSGNRYAKADDLFEACSQLFVQARYFYEQVGADWVMIDHPMEYMLRMIDVLATVYDGYLERGGWA